MSRDQAHPFQPVTLLIPPGYRPLLVPERLRLHALVDDAERHDCEHVIDPQTGLHTWLDRQAVRRLTQAINATRGLQRPDARTETRHA